MFTNWDPWRGCTRYSEGCKNCYILNSMEKKGELEYLNGPILDEQKLYSLLKTDKQNNYIVKPQTIVWTCFRTDFFHEKADSWRSDAWKVIEKRSDLSFFIITKRIDRFFVKLPDNWNNGYDNVTICCTVENQEIADFRLPIYNSLPIKHKMIICQPLIDYIDLSLYLNNNIEQVTVGGESGPNARVCKYDWIIALRNQCVEKNVIFEFRETGTYFEKDGNIRKINPFFQHKEAKLININYYSRSE